MADRVIDIVNEISKQIKYFFMVFSLFNDGESFSGLQFAEFYPAKIHTVCELR